MIPRPVLPLPLFSWPLIFLLLHRLISFLVPIVVMFQRDLSSLWVCSLQDISSMPMASKHAGNTQIHSSSLDISSALQSHISSCLMSIIFTSHSTSAKPLSPDLSQLTARIRSPKIRASEVCWVTSQPEPWSAGTWLFFLTATPRSGPQQIFLGGRGEGMTIATQLVFLRSASSHLQTHLPHHQKSSLPKIYLIVFLSSSLW